MENERWLLYELGDTSEEGSVKNERWLASVKNVDAAGASASCFATCRCTAVVLELYPTRILLNLHTRALCGWV